MNCGAGCPGKIPSAEDKLARLKEFHDQIVILRGSMLNGVLLWVLSLFGICACCRAGRAYPLRLVAYYLPAALLVWYGLYSLFHHFDGIPHNSFPYHDPPLAESVLIVTGLAGFMVCRRTNPEDFRFYRNVWIVAFVLTLAAYGAWWWTEVMYDEQVIHSSLQAAAQH